MPGGPGGGGGVPGAAGPPADGSASTVAAWCAPPPPAGGAGGGPCGGSCEPRGDPGAEPCGPSTAGATVVLGRALPSGISAVFASGLTRGGGADRSPSSSLPLIGGANTVMGGGTDAPSPPLPLVSAASHGEPPPGVADAGSGAGGAEGTDGGVAEAEGAGAGGGVADDADGDADGDEGDADEDGAGPPTEPPEPSVPSDPLPGPRRPGMPIWSAASCNHSGGVSRNDVASRSTRCGRTGAGSAGAAPYSSWYRRITSPTGNPGHSVDSPLSRAITSRCRPPPDDGPSGRSSAQATKPRSNSRTRTSRCWYAGTPPLIQRSARSCACANVTIEPHPSTGTARANPPSTIRLATVSNSGG